MSKIGFAGIGLMGLPMCHRLLAAGHDLSVWNRSAEKYAALVSAGAHQAESLAMLARDCDIIMLCVSDTHAVQQLVNGADGLLAGLSARKIVVDFSSIAPTATRELAALVKSKGAHWVDAPVSGGVVGAETGALVVMAGGETDIIDGLRPILAVLSQRVTHMGPTGAGQVSKICNQLIVAANAVLIAEAVALAEKSGVNTAKLAPALAGGFADSKPFQLLVPRMSSRQFEPVQWRVKTLLKDLDMAVSLAQQENASVSLATHAAEIMREHGASGALEKDLSSLITFLAGQKNPC